MDFVEYIHDFTIGSIILRLVLSMVYGGIIGFERETKRHSAGFRTFTLVCISSALITIANIYLNIQYGSADISRIPAGIISGIGFIGAGTIIITRKNQVKGLTTAAGLLATTSLGIALGAGMIEICTLAIILILFTMTVLRYLGTYIATTNSEIRLYIEFDTEEGIMEMRNYLRARGYRTNSFERAQNLSAFYDVDLTKHMKHSEVISDISSSVKGVVYIEES